VVLLLHGFPTSSHMFRNLIPLLADKYHVIAPDYPGYGQSDAPDHTKFAYTFANQPTSSTSWWASSAPSATPST
jgi:pimeloyl-ACP methyl ester carboxylesterase